MAPVCAGALCWREPSRQAPVSGSRAGLEYRQRAGGTKEGQQQILDEPSPRLGQVASTIL